tara:strand:+ start:201 stop:413 length:213 start_codon:yes stop_codon:yes gene_type:complete
MTGAIDIQLNGELCHVMTRTSMVMLLHQLGLDERSVVVELNRKIIRRTEMESLFLKKGDSIELVHFVGGG